ncbi:Aminoacyl-tRNA synthetase class II (D/K/N), partial [Trinorchestia longiramus]
QVRSQHYDLVCDGWEVGGGSVRIHDHVLQRQILHLLQDPPSHLSYFTDALSMGAPPHAGIALGIERLTALLCGASSIRDVTAFPKTSLGRCLLTGAPNRAGE